MHVFGSHCAHHHRAVADKAMEIFDQNSDGQVKIRTARSSQKFPTNRRGPQHLPECNAVFDFECISGRLDGVFYSHFALEHSRQTGAYLCLSPQLMLSFASTRALQVDLPMVQDFFDSYAVRPNHLVIFSRPKFISSDCFNHAGCGWRWQTCV
jgi:hypothetical protein